MILLTDEEIGELENSIVRREGIEVGARAQLKKVVEWLDGHGYLQLKYGEPIRGVLEDEWQALKEEAGL